MYCRIPVNALVNVLDCCCEIQNQQQIFYHPLKILDSVQPIEGDFLYWKQCCLNYGPAFDQRSLFYRLQLSTPGLEPISYEGCFWATCEDSLSVSVHCLHWFDWQLRDRSRPKSWNPIAKVCRLGCRWSIWLVVWCASQVRWATTPRSRSSKLQIWAEVSLCRSFWILIGMLPQLALCASSCLRPRKCSYLV